MQARQEHWQSSDIKSFYEKEGQVVRRYQSESFWERRYHQAKFRIVLDMLNRIVIKNDLVLDAGSGTGELSHVAKQLGGQVVGLDLSRSYLTRIKGATGERVQASIEYLPFKEDLFDTVICADVLEHVLAYERAIAELLRTCRRAIVITTPCEGLLRGFLVKLLRVDVDQIDRKVGHLHILSLSELKKKLLKPRWRAKCRSHHVIQPIAEGVLPKELAIIVEFLERIGDVLLPGLGTISSAVLMYDAKEAGSVV